MCNIVIFRKLLILNSVNIISKMLNLRKIIFYFFSFLDIHKHSWDAIVRCIPLNPEYKFKQNVRVDSADVFFFCAEFFLSLSPFSWDQSEESTSR